MNQNYMVPLLRLGRFSSDRADLFLAVGVRVRDSDWCHNLRGPC